MLRKSLAEENIAAIDENVEIVEAEDDDDDDVIFAHDENENDGANEEMSLGKRFILAIVIVLFLVLVDYAMAYAQINYSIMEDQFLYHVPKAKTSVGEESLATSSLFEQLQETFKSSVDTIGAYFYE